MTSQNEQAASTADIAYPTESGPSMGEAAEPAASDTSNTPLLPSDLSESLGGQWDAIQAQFVDSPRDAVQQADALVANVIQELAKTFADERASLEQQWDRDEDVDTEALRMALQRYRSFFQRLLAA